MACRAELDQPDLCFVALPTTTCCGAGLAISSRKIKATPDPQTAPSANSRAVGPAETLSPSAGKGERARANRATLPCRRQAAQRNARAKPDEILHVSLHLRRSYRPWWHHHQSEAKGGGAPTAVAPRSYSQGWWADVRGSRKGLGKTKRLCVIRNWPLRRSDDRRRGQSTQSPSAKRSASSTDALASREKGTHGSSDQADFLAVSP